MTTRREFLAHLELGIPTREVKATDVWQFQRAAICVVLKEKNIIAGEVLMKPVHRKQSVNCSDETTSSAKAVVKIAADTAFVIIRKAVPQRNRGHETTAFGVFE